MRLPTVTVAQNQSESAEIDLRTETAIGFIVPAAIEATTAQISFKAADKSAGTFLPVYKDGVKLTLPITVSTLVRFEDLFSLFDIRFLKIILEDTAGTAVSQATAARIFNIETVSL